MNITLKELEAKLKEMRSDGATDETEIDFDLDNTNVEYDEYFPTFYYQKCGFSNYIQVTLTGSNV